MKTILVTVLFAAALSATQLVLAQDKAADVTDMQALRAAVRADKKAYVASVLKLTPAEAKRFWPIYDTYQRELEAANRRVTLAVEAVVLKEGSLTNLYARSLANELISADEAEVKARRKLYTSLTRRVPGRTMLPTVKVDRYLQLEAKIRAFQDYDIASTIPLVKEK